MPNFKHPTIDIRALGTADGTQYQANDDGVFENVSAGHAKDFAAHGLLQVIDTQAAAPVKTPEVKDKDAEPVDEFTPMGLDALKEALAGFKVLTEDEIKAVKSKADGRALARKLRDAAKAQDPLQ